MYAIVQTGGKQYKAAVGDVISVEKLDAEVGAEVTFDVLLVADGETITVEEHPQEERPSSAFHQG